MRRVCYQIYGTSHHLANTITVACFSIAAAGLKLQTRPILNSTMFEYVMRSLDKNCLLTGIINWHHIKWTQKHNGKSSKKSYWKRRNKSIPSKGINARKKKRLGIPIDKNTFKATKKKHRVWQGILIQEIQRNIKITPVR